MAPFTYILPIKRHAVDAEADAELTGYLHWLSSRCQLLIVDASPPAVFTSHANAWQSLGRHLGVADDLTGANGKVRGVLTALRHAEHERIVIADDDVRYDDIALRQAILALNDAHLVRPQNYFEPRPWHAVVDTGRSLLNRAMDGDWPGTLAVRRSAMTATQGYCGDVLFENLELERTITAAGGRAVVAREIYVRRLPPSTQHFLDQRVRQAYDEFARPMRLVTQLAILPFLLTAFVEKKFWAMALLVAATIVVAEIGRRRAAGARFFPLAASVLSPIWVIERAVCAWLALLTRVRHGGVRYAGRVLSTAATPVRVLRRRHDGAITSTSIGLNDPLLDSSAEQAVTPTIMSISARSSR